MKKYLLLLLIPCSALAADAPKATQTDPRDAQIQQINQSNVALSQLVQQYSNDLLQAKFQIQLLTKQLADLKASLPAPQPASTSPAAKGG